jgi:CheY-like chemotaxis protein
MHGGRVEAHSEGPGKGSEFVVRLPASAGPRQDCPASAPQTPSTDAGRQVLIIEDNPDGRTTLEAVLKLLGHHVETAATGPEGIEKALATRPDVALIDLGLPGLDGYQVAGRLRAALGQGVVLVALTGHASEEVRRRALDAGFNIHIAKPVNLEDLQRVLSAPSAQ